MMSGILALLWIIIRVWGNQAEGQQLAAPQHILHLHTRLVLVNGPLSRLSSPSICYLWASLATWNEWDSLLATKRPTDEWSDEPCKCYYSWMSPNGVRLGEVCGGLRFFCALSGEEISHFFGQIVLLRSAESQKAFARKSQGRPKVKVTFRNLEEILNETLLRAISGHAKRQSYRIGWLHSLRSRLSDWVIVKCGFICESTERRL